MYIITGGGSGLGRALALSLAQRGKTVLVVGRRENLLQETADLHEFIDYFCADISHHKGRKLLLDSLSDVRQIDALINNAGLIEPIMPIKEIGESAWRAVMATNVEAPMFLSQMLIQKLRDGRVLNIGSGAAYIPVEGWSAYCVSKAALSMLSRCWELESNEVFFSSVMPGIIDTNMQTLIRAAEHMDEEKLEFFRRLKQEGQLLTADTVADFLIWLLLDIEASRFSAQEWDIYDSSHHSSWLRAPKKVPMWE